MEKQIQIGWVFHGVDIVSKTYTKTCTFPADVSASKSCRGYGNEQEPENMYDVTARDTDWRRENGDETRPLPQQFEVTIVERHNGKVIAVTYEKSVPVMVTVDVPDEPEEPAAE